jgi:hypothetical protein
MPENAAPSVRDFHCLRQPCEIENLLIQRLKSSAKIAEVPPLLKRGAAAERGSELSFCSLCGLCGLARNQCVAGDNCGSFQMALATGWTFVVRDLVSFVFFVIFVREPMTQPGSRMKEGFLTKNTKNTKNTNRFTSRLAEKIAGKRLRISRQDARSAKSRKEACP